MVAISNNHFSDIIYQLTLKKFSIPPTQTVVTFFYTKIDFIPIIFTLTQTITSINQIIIILDNYRVL